MLPPVLEIYVVWHPGDAAGAQICEEFLEHFHGSAFSGLIGGAIEVYARSTGWQGKGDAPRPIPHGWLRFLGQISHRDKWICRLR